MSIVLKMTTGTITKMKAKKWDIWLASVKFEDSPVSKKRPVLIIEEGVCIVVSLKMTSQKPRGGDDYILKEWIQAGLTKETVVRTKKIIHLSESCLIRKLGELQASDAHEVHEMLGIL